MCARVGLWISTAEPIKIHSPWLIQQSLVLDCESCPTSVKFHHPTLEWFYKSCTDTVRGRWVGKQFVLQSVPRLPFPQLLCYTIHVILYIYSWIWSRAKIPRFHFSHVPSCCPGIFTRLISIFFVIGTSLTSFYLFENSRNTSHNFPTLSPGYFYVDSLWYALSDKEVNFSKRICIKRFSF